MASHHGGYPLGEEDDDHKPKLKRDKDGILRREGRQYEFDCPECDANNPWGDGFGDGDEIRCNYCGQDFKVEFREGAKTRYRPV